ncbi:MAG: hypothetical protein KBB50_01210, partial [Candidatus Pacebacteria bacterium]|nr:hypothetical protein [Candidatus Paceibacterota bacterium]
MNKVKAFIFLISVYALYNSFVYALVTYEPNQPIVIGEFLFDDDYNATTSDCWINMYNPLGVTVASDAIMGTSSNGWHYYNYAGSSTLGVWPTIMSCGTAGVDLVKMDKSFSIATTAQVIASAVWNNDTRVLTDYSTATIASAVWASPARSLTTFGTLIADIWTSGTRTLTGAGLDSGSLATASDVSNASSSLSAQIQTTNTAVLNASSSLGAQIQTVSSDIASINISSTTIATAVWASPARSLTTFG